MFVPGCDYVKTDDPIVYVFVSCLFTFCFAGLGWSSGQSLSMSCECHSSYQ